MNRPPLDPLYAAARAYVAAVYGPDCRCQVVRLYVTGIDAPVNLPLPPRCAGNSDGHAEPDSRRAQPANRHSVDFRSVWWGGREWPFTAGQAPVIRVLWQAWEALTPDVSQEAILEAIDSDGTSLRELFRDNEAWGVVIVPGRTRATFRIAEPSA